jgi:hypothetical protein
VTFTRELVDPDLQHGLAAALALIHLMHGTDEFRWNLHESDKFFMDTMYITLIQTKVPNDNNKNVENEDFVRG